MANELAPAEFFAKYAKPAQDTCHGTGLCASVYRASGHLERLGWLVPGDHLQQIRRHQGCLRLERQGGTAHLRSYKGQDGHCAGCLPPLR